MKLLNMLGLAKKSEVEELNRKLENALWFVQQIEANRKDDAIIVGTDFVVIQGARLENGKRILVSPSAQFVTISNVHAE